MGYDPATGPDPNAEAMAEAADRVRWGEVTWAVRAAVTTAGKVNEGDHLALLHHDIVAVAADLAEACCALLDKLVDGESELVTVVEGEAATPDATARIKEWLSERWPDVAIDVHRGDQPLSAYLFSAE
jgi:dihydroxyacetone kinase-like predicted kinase